jgi:hypothetical protein
MLPKAEPGNKRYLVPVRSFSAYGRIVSDMTGDPPRRKKSVSPEVSAYLSGLGKRGGKIGGKKAAEKLSPTERSERAKKASDAVSLTPKERSERAKKAAAARWGKKAAKKKT